MQYFHVGIIVEDIEAAREELSRALGVHWGATHESSYGKATIRVCYSREGPPYVELVEGEPGSTWDTARGSHVDHLGFWSEDLDADMRRLEAEGLPVDIDGTKFGRRFAYHRTQHSGLRVELIDVAIREAILAQAAGEV